MCLSGCSSITELARAMGLALFERAIVPVASHHPLCVVLELWASEVWHYLEISPKKPEFIMYSSYMQGGMNSAISPDESTKPDDSKTLLFVPDTPLRFGAMGL